MQRPTYGQSPPLHHPVPQHVSTVPQLRSPPPPPGSQPQSQNYSNPYQPHAGAGAGAGAGGAAAPNGNVFGQYGNFMNEPTAQFAAQFGQSAFKHGQEYLEQNVSCLDFDSQPRCRYERLQKSNGKIIHVFERVRSAPSLKSRTGYGSAARGRTQE